MLSRLEQHPNIVSVKLTCGGIVKVTRVRSQFQPEEFCASAGQSDGLVPTMAGGSTGSITGVANLYPKVWPAILLYESNSPRHDELYADYDPSSASRFIIPIWLGRRRRPMRHMPHIELAKMEWGFAKGGVNGKKWVVAKLRG